MRSRLQVGRFAALAALFGVAALSVALQAQHMSAEVARNTVTLGAERASLRYMRDFVPLLLDLQDLRASGRRDAQLPFAGAAARVRSDLAVIERSGSASEVPSELCEMSWRTWRGRLAAWTARPTGPFETIAREGTCFVTTAGVDSPLSVDQDQMVQRLSSMFGESLPALVRRIGTAASLIDQAPRGFSRRDVVEVARSSANVERLENFLEAFSDDDARAEPNLRVALLAAERRPVAMVHRFEGRIDALLEDSAVRTDAPGAIERLAAAAIDGERPLWNVGLNEIGDRLDARARFLGERRRDISLGLGFGLLGSLGLVVLLGWLFARRQETQVTRLRLERDALAAQIGRSVAERSLSLTESQLRVVFENSEAGIAIFDDTRRIVAANAAFAEFGRADGEFAALVATRAEPLFAGPAAALRFELSLPGVAGAERYLGFAIAGVYERERCRYAIATVQDVSERRRHEATLRFDARHDRLTGLENRAALEERLDECCSEKPVAFTLLFLDLNGFKPINDTYGHAVGDAVLAAFGARLRALFPARDLVARSGGDEFAVVVRGRCDRSGAQALAGRIGEALGQPFAVPDTVVSVSASIGIVTANGPAPNPGRVLARADAAMYDAKSRGLPFAFASEGVDAAGLRSVPGRS